MKNLVCELLYKPCVLYDLSIISYDYRGMGKAPEEIDSRGVQQCLSTPLHGKLLVFAV